MKYIFIFLSAIVHSSAMNAQNTEDRKETPQIITKLRVGEKATFDNSSVLFLKVIEDTRCPSDLNCVWAGHAKVLVGFYENETLIKEKEIIIGSNAISPTNPKELLKLEKKVIFGYNLTPYPSGQNKINTQDYYLELLVR